MAKRKTHEQFIEDVFKSIGNEYEVLGYYIKSNTKILFKHILCGNEFLMRPNDFLNGQRCPKCSRPNYYRDTIQYKREVFDLVGNEYSVFGEYVYCKNKVLMKHNTCNYEWFITPSDFLNGRRCPICVGKNVQKTTNQFKQEVFNLVGDEYEILGKYINDYTKIKIFHKVCKNSYEVSPSNFLAGRRCPKCNESRGEKLISDIFNKIKIIFLQQYRFHNCRNKKPLPFDFAVFDENNNLIFLIEYDGKQHYKPFYKLNEIKGKEQLKYIQRNDSIKNEYCQNNNISLLRIPYWDFDNIEQILNKELSKYNSLGGDYQREVKINDSFKLGCIST